MLLSRPGLFYRRNFHINYFRYIAIKRTSWIRSNPPWIVLATGVGFVCGGCTRQTKQPEHSGPVPVPVCRWGPEYTGPGVLGVIVSIQWERVTHRNGVRWIGSVLGRWVYAVGYRRVGSGCAGNETIWYAFLIRDGRYHSMAVFGAEDGAGAAKWAAEKHFQEHIRPGLVDRLMGLVATAALKDETDADPADVVLFSRAAREG